MSSTEFRIQENENLASHQQQAKEKQAISGYETPIGENCSGILPCSTSKKSATSPAEQPNKGEKLGLLSTAEKETVRTEPKKHFGWGLRGEYQYDPRHCEEWW